MPNTGPPSRAEFEDLDWELTCVQAMVFNSFWPSVAVAAALIDRGVIEKDDLLRITESLIAVVSSETVVDFGEVDDKLLALSRFRDVLEGLPLSKGEVHRELQAHEARSYLKEMLRQMRRPPNSEEDRG